MTALLMPLPGRVGPIATGRSLGQISATLRGHWGNILLDTRRGPPRPPPPDDEPVDEQAALLIALTCAAHY